MASSGRFHVRRSKTELLSPAEPTPHEFKPLSDIDDQGTFRFRVPIILFYPYNPSVPTSSRDPRLVIKGALSKALVYYYPFAGRLREVGRPSCGKHVVECNGEGILYTQAESDIKLEQFYIGKRIQPPFPLDQLFSFDVPAGSSGIILNCPILSIQVTRFACGGFIFSLRFNHTMCDGQGMVQFLNAVAEIAQGAKAPSVLPVWERELIFKARDPPRVTQVHQEYDQQHMDQLEISPNINSEDVSLIHDDLVDRSIYFGPSEVSALRSHLPPHLKHSCSTFEIVTACLWRCRTIALNPASTETARLIHAVSVRDRLPSLPVGYYGNAVALPAAVTTVENLCKNPLGYVVELIKKAKSAINWGDYLQSVADFMVLNNRPLILTRTTYLVSDNSRIGWTEVDFGWGKPLYAGPVEAASAGFSPGIINFYVRSRNNEGDEDGILVPTRLPKLCMEKFVFELKRMTSTDHVGTQNSRL